MFVYAHDNMSDRQMNEAGEAASQIAGFRFGSTGSLCVGSSTLVRLHIRFQFT